jgi:beta-glucosidase
MSSQYIQGLQSLGVSATIKHFVANEQETQRTTVDETISERALREIYLKPFEIAVREAQPWAVMTAYNLVNGVHCDNHEWLIQKVLRGQWGWKGLLMSDWGGTNSVADGLNAGLDLEMPGPPRIRKLPAVLEAIKKGEVTEAAIDDRARSVIDFCLKLDYHRKQSTPLKPGETTDTPELRALLRDSAAKGMVLLKNEGDILPLSAEKLKGKKVALIGFSKDAMAHGGGSAAVNSYYKVSPWDGLKAALGDDVEFTFAAGAHRERLLPPINKDGSAGTVTGLDGQPGFTQILYTHGTNEEYKVKHGHGRSAYSPLGSQESLWRSLEIVGDFTPLEGGSHYIACSGIGPTRVYVDDDIVFEQPGNSSDPMGSLFLAAPEPEVQHKFEAGKTYRIRIRSECPVGIGLEILEGRSGVRVGFSLESVHDADLKGEAAKVAADADLAIIFSGHDPQWETEGRDQDSFNLPRGQNDMIAAVAAANKNVIVVNSTGVAVSMPWLPQVRGLVQAWFPGQEAGNAMADILTGGVNPEGHLPVTFPRAIEDAPAHGNFPGEYVDGKLKVKYEEGVFIGYRHFDRLEKSKVNFPFGYGLSYTTFETTSLTVSRDAELLRATVSVKNTGARSGGTVVQVYGGSLTKSMEHPVKRLIGFEKVLLEAGEARDVEVEVSLKDAAYYDEAAQQWTIDEGRFGIFTGSSAADITWTEELALEKMTWAP